MITMRPTPSWIHNKEDGFGRFIAHIKHYLRDLKTLDPKDRELSWLGSVPYIRPSSLTPQKTYVPINEVDFEKVLAKSLNEERGQLGDKGKAKVNVFVYLTDNEVNQHASQTRTKEAPQQVNNTMKTDPRGTGHFSHTNISRNRPSSVATASQPHRSSAGPPSSRERLPNAPPLVPGANKFCIDRAQLEDNQWDPSHIHVRAGDLIQALGLGTIARTPAGYTERRP